MTPAELMQEYAKALASQDWQNVAPLFHAKASVTFSSGTFKGKDEVRQAFERTFDLIKNEQYAISDLHWVIERGTAVCLYSFSWSGLINGQPSSGRGRGTSVLVEVGDGWQIVSEHLGPHAP